MDHCHVMPIEKHVALSGNEKLETIFMRISGMGCPNCALRVRNGLLGVSGVIGAEVDHITGTARVTIDGAYMNILSLVDAVAQAGDEQRHTYRAALVISKRHESLGLS
jgi:copper chaperone CopZ